MNFLLLEPGEIGTDLRCTLQGRRARHVREVLRAEAGTELRAGVLNGQLGRATVLASSAQQVTVELQLERTLPVAEDVLLLAVPRPKVLLRMLAHAAAMGFARIVLFRSWRVDKTWMQSRDFEPSVQREQLLLGLEQAGRTQLPEILRFDLFKPMIEDVLPTLALPATRFVAHPTAATPTHQLAPFHQANFKKGPFALAIGPDGGFLPYEVEQFQKLGCHAISCGPHALRTETALAVLWGQLDLLRSQGSVVR